MHRTLKVLLLTCTLVPGTGSAQENADAIEAMEDYLDFVEYGGGTILAQQIPAKDWQDFFIIDARNAAQYDKEHIPGAVNIEWRQVLARRSELPKDRFILIYCTSAAIILNYNLARFLVAENLTLGIGGNRPHEHHRFDTIKLGIHCPGNLGVPQAIVDHDPAPLLKFDLAGSR